MTNTRSKSRSSVQQTRCSRIDAGKSHNRTNYKQKCNFLTSYAGTVAAKALLTQFRILETNPGSFLSVTEEKKRESRQSLFIIRR